MDVPVDKSAKHWFYGVDNTHFKLGAEVIRAVEDPDDGYRSCLDKLELAPPGGLIFPARPLDRVQLVERNQGTILDLVSVRDGHVWLSVGTEREDDYYPWFLFEYHPRSLRTRP